MTYYKSRYYALKARTAEHVVTIKVGEGRYANMTEAQYMEWFLSQPRKEGTVNGSIEKQR